MKFYLFGVAGAGKTYVGELLQKNLGMRFVDADQWITADTVLMREFEEKGCFTQELRDLAHDIIAHNIAKIAADDEDIIIAQASIKAANRRQLITAHPNIKMIYIYADEATLLKRVAARGGIVSPENVKTMLRNFDAPTAGFVIDSTTSDLEIIAQFNAIYRQVKPVLKCKI